MTNFKIIDQLRGLAFILMFIHHIHYFYDVNNDYNTNTANSKIINMCGTISRSLFILLVGISLYHNFKKFNNKKHLFIYNRINKTMIILLHAMIITCLTCIVYPKYPIYFGVLHYIAIASFLSCFLIDKPTFAFILAIIMTIFSSQIYNNIYDLNIYTFLHTMLGTRSKSAIDYFPLLKWIPLLLLGIFIGYIQDNPNAELFDEIGIYKKPINDFLTFFGKNSLNLYTIHIILLILYYKNILSKN